MTNSLTSNEREEPTIRTGGEDLSIFEIMQRYRNDGSCEQVIQEALWRLSLVDSQAAEGDTVSRKEVIARIEQQIRLWNNDTVTMACADALADIKQLPALAAATAMRDRCVELVKAAEREALSTWSYKGGSVVLTCRDLASKMQSLTLDSREQIRNG